MNPVYIALLLTLAVATATVLYGARKSPKHLFIAWDAGMGTVQPYTRKTLKGRLTFEGSNGPVMFPMDPSFVLPRQDGRGTVLIGDTTTGRLMRPGQDGSWIPMDGIMAEAALADGRVESLVRATQAGGITLKHIMWALAVVGSLVVVVIYQFAKGTGGAT